ncbi:uncharacterized protein LOC143208144 [Lasioglossum baleicum]|uniref:uncharacterized protein LOC143208144 n=1 Tax=Lasioglossum baleicum TaxID=434251 RepID=UPI003FCE1917
MAKKCRVRIKCGWCSRRHVLLMCPNVGSRENVREPKASENERKPVNENNLAALCESPSVCLQTLRIKLFSESKEKIVRAVIDTASQRSYVRTNVARELGYVAIGKQEVTHSLFGGVKTESKVHDMFRIRMRSVDNSYACNFAAMNQDTICDTIPSVKQETWVDELRSRNIRLTDIGQESSPIDVLIGADVAGKLLTGKKCELRNGLVALETSLGWTVIGKLPGTAVRNGAAVMITSMYVQEADLSDLWRLDVVGITDPIEKVDKTLRNKETQDFLQKTARLTSGGRYEVRLPLKENHTLMSSNFEISRKEVAEIEKADFSHYLPHRPVVKPYGTTRIRPVFDASACKKGDPSLNQCLEKGPNLIELVPTALNRFRENEIGVTVESVEKLRRAFYVDNCVTSVESESELKKFEAEAKSIMAMGGFDLRGWESSGDFMGAEASLVLGLLWNKRTDVISINPAVLDMKKPETVTKRSMLSASYRVLDPIGFTCPASLLPRKLLRDLWSEKIGWDTRIDDKRRETFNSWLDELNSLKEIQIPRKLGKGSVTLHTFCDASGEAYAAVVFARIEGEGVVNVRLMSARSRIAPKTATIPRLELMAATIGVRLARAVLDSLTREVQQVTYWSDSTTEIRDASSRERWRYVPGDRNPADLPSRGRSPSQLLESQWWLGPEWLYGAESEWPVSRHNVDEEEINREVKRSLVQMLSVENSEFVYGDHFSSYERLIRAAAWMHRFLGNCRCRTLSGEDPGVGRRIIGKPLWWGGWWERLIGVVKTILRKVLGKANLTYEGLTTTLCDVEAIINSRPLTYMAEESSDLKPLTPAMFLQEIREIGVPDLDMLWHRKLNTKFRNRLKLFEDLRARFRSEYLGQLVLKKDKKETREIMIGDVVLIGDDNTRRIDWPLARVVDKFISRDGESRVFMLKTKTGILKRPVQRVYPLEIPREETAFAENLRARAQLDKCGNKPDCKPVQTSNSSKQKRSEAQNCEQYVKTTRGGRIVKKPERLGLKIEAAGAGSLRDVNEKHLVLVRLPHDEHVARTFITRLHALWHYSY